MTKKKKRLLIIDSLNIWFRAYIVNPTLSTNGQPIGGIVGYFKILQKLCRDTNPDQIIICWDGEGGSQKRKSQDKGYKEGRKPIRLNRSFHNLSENEELENKIWQMTRCFEYLNNLPIVQTMLPAVEADDVIAYVANMPQYKDWQKVIVSSDKDFYQLCDEGTVVFRPIQKQVVNKNHIIEEYGIHPTNFALARAIAGDKSDNLKGVGGVGLATIAKRLPFLVEEQTYTVDEVVEHCKNTEHELKAYTNIVNGKKTIEHNYKMMQLYSPSISVQGKKKVRHAIEEFVPELNKTNFQTMMVNDGFGVIDFSYLFAIMKRIVAESNYLKTDDDD